MIDVCLLGTGGTMPLPNRWLSALLVRHAGRLLLVDCGEGTQITWKALGWGFRDLDAILLTHLHADHVAGLVGVLFMLGAAERREPLTIWGPPGTAAAVRGLRVIAPRLPYEVHCHELAGGERFEAIGLGVRCLPVDHPVPCLAYRFDLDRGRRFLPERAQALGVPLPLWRELQRGEAVAWHGGAAVPDDVLGPPRPGLALAIVTDTRPTPELPAFAAGVDLLVCEGMYGDEADLEKAREVRHMLFRESAAIAREAGAGELWLTHFSPALLDPERYLPNATAIFPNTVVGRDRLTTTLRFRAEAPPG